MAENTAISWCDRACTRCGVVKGAAGFHVDRSHADGRASVCVDCRNAAARARYVPKGPPVRHGPLPAPARDGDKLQARHRVNRAVKAGEIPPPNSLPCADCGHVHAPGGMRHEYDHHLGYGAAHQLSVEAVCTACHHKRDNRKARQDACIHGHPFTPENTIMRANGTRSCRECRRAHDRGRRDASYWRDYRARRGGRSQHDARPL